MNTFQTVKYLKKLLLGISLALILLVILPTTAPVQAAPITGQCRQANPNAGAGLVAFFSSDGTKPITAVDGNKDGPAAGADVYLTAPSAETSANGQFVRVWFKSIDPNFKIGWVALENDALKMGTSSWRAQNCIQ